MSREIVDVLIDFLSYLTVFGGFVAVVLLILYFESFFKASTSKTVTAWGQTLSAHALAFLFLFSAVATIGSLFLSEVAGFAPCKLCWYQRVFMYPVAVITGIALYVGDKKIFKYVIALAVVGLLIAVYHYLIQMFPENIQCGDETAACSARQAARFGFVTIPFMSGVAFVNIILLSLWGLRKSS